MRFQRGNTASCTVASLGIEFRILGPLEVHDGDRPLSVGGARQQALLAVLLLHANETLSADRLIDELWGEHPPPTAAKTVQVYISRLRKALGGEGVVATRAHGYELRLPDPDQLDATRFERLVAEGRGALDEGRAARAAALLEEALGLWRGSPLSGLLAGPGVGQLEDVRVAALELLSEAELALGQHAQVVERLERLVVEHPFRERFRAQLMLALYRCDRQAEALQAYRDARRVLADELGIEPGERLRELERAILTHDPRLDLPAPLVEAASAGAFVGRDAELAELTAGLEEAIAGHGRLFLLVGEPGIGKSRLAEELSAVARARDALVLVGRCWEAGGAPAYWPWVQSLRAYVRRVPPEVLRAQLGPGAADVAQLLPELRELLPDLPPVGSLDSDGARFRLFDSVSAFLAAVAAAQPVVLALDDLHAGDEPSLLLLQFVARGLAGHRVLIVGAYRDVDPTVSVPLRETVAALTREPVTRVLELGGLAEPDVARYIELAAPAVAELGPAVFAETEGNPLFVGEIVRLLDKEGQLAIPNSVRETIGRRLRHLSGDCNALLATASVLGREFDLRVLARVSGLSRGALLELLDEAAQARVVSDVPGTVGRMRFAHALIRDAAYSGLSRARRVELHGEVGAALEAIHAADLEPHLAELAYHFYEAAAGWEGGKAVDYASRAGARAVTLLAYEEAERLYELALAAFSGEVEARCELLLALGDAQGRRGDDPRAKATFLTAAELARGAGSGELLARATAGYGGRFLWAHGLTDERLVPLLEEGLAAVGPGDSQLRVRLLSRLAAALRHGPTRARREVLMDEAIQMARRIGDPVTIASALTAAESALHAPHTARLRLANAGEIAALAVRAGDREREFDGHEHAFWASWELGDPDRRARELAEMTRVAAELRQPAQQWMLAAAHATLALAQGRFDEAPDLIAHAFAIGEPVLAWNASAARVLQRFLVCVERGGLAEYVDEVRDREHLFPSPLVHRSVLAHAFARLDQPDEATALVREIMRHDLSDWHVDEQWFVSICLLAETCGLLDLVEHAPDLYALIAPYADHHAVAVPEMAMDSAGRPLGILAGMLGEFAVAERHFADAVAANERMGAVVWAEHTRRARAQLLAR